MMEQLLHMDMKQIEAYLNFLLVNIAVIFYYLPSSVMTKSNTELVSVVIYLISFLLLLYMNSID